MKFKSSLALTAALATSMLIATVADAQTRTLVKPLNASPVSILDRIKAPGGGPQELDCGHVNGHLQCQSDLAWVCPAGWSACTPDTPGGTCCEQN